MPKSTGAHRVHVLKALTIGKLPAGRHGDGGGLYCEVEPSGSRRWTLRVRVHGRRKDIGLGSVSTVGLAEARQKAAELRKVAREGGDPLAHRERSQSPTFEQAALKCYEERAEAWRNKKHRDQWLSSLKAYAFPLIGSVRVDHIGTAEVLNVLQPIWLEKPETARRVRQRIGLTLDWAKVRGFRAMPSPTREIGSALPKHKRTQRHHPAMPYTELPGFIGTIWESDARSATKAAMEFLILTATRTNEALQARWDEVDLGAKTWTLPASRMKAGKPHTVPLSRRALEILHERKADHSGQGGFIFEAKPGQALSNMALLMIMRRMKLEAVPHGFRSSFRDWAAEAVNAPRDIAEACLAHVVEDKVERAYRRTDFLEQRRKLMERWATHCGNAGGKIVPFDRAKARSR